MRRPHLAFAAMLGAALVAACRDVPAPESGIFAISPLTLPSPSVVAGDTMRDSLGAVAPLRVIAFGVGGDTVTPPPAITFVVLDTGAHTAGAFLIGDQAGTTVRVVGSVAGLQTQPQNVLVTLRPDTLIPADSARQVRGFDRTLRDTVVNVELNVLVQNRATAPVGVDGTIVRYEITSAPPVVGSGPSVVLLNGNVQSARDTTSNGGRASRTLRFRILAVDPARTDSAAVTAMASYRGQSLGVVQFTIVFQPQ